MDIIKTVPIKRKKKKKYSTLWIVSPFIAFVNGIMINEYFWLFYGKKIHKKSSMSNGKQISINECSQKNAQSRWMNKYLPPSYQCIVDASLAAITTLSVWIGLHQVCTSGHSNFTPFLCGLFKSSYFFLAFTACFTSLSCLKVNLVKRHSSLAAHQDFCVLWH